MNIDLYEELFGFLSVVIVNIAAITVTYLRLKGDNKKVMDDIKSHTETAITSLNGMLSYVIESFPSPCWLKVATEEADGEVKFKMLYCNDQYKAAYKIDDKSLIGKTDLEAGWDHETAKQFREHDLLVWVTGEEQVFVENVDGVPKKFKQILIKSKDGKKRGVMGYALDYCDTPVS